MAQDVLVAGQPSTVQNAYAPNSEKGDSVTDQRHRLVAAWVADMRPFGCDQPVLSTLFNSWTLSNIVTVGSGRPVDARIIGDANQDGNSTNDRLPGVGRNSVGRPWAMPPPTCASLVSCIWAIASS